jgi:predicted esterase
MTFSERTIGTDLGRCADVTHRGHANLTRREVLGAIGTMMASSVCSRASLILPASPGETPAGGIPVVRVDPGNMTGETMIQEWRMLGVFPVGKRELQTAGYQNGAAGLDKNYLSSVNADEADLDAARFARIGDSFGPNAIQAVDVHSKSELIESTQYFNVGDYGVTYAAVIIDSVSAADVAFFLANTHGMKVWLNHKLLLSTGFSWGAQKFQHILRAQLSQGSNFLLVKKAKINDTVYAYGFPSAFSVGLSSLAYGKHITKLLCREMIANTHSGFWPTGSNVLGDGEELRIALPLFASEPATLEILTPAGRSILSERFASFPGEWRKHLSGLPRGLYNCRVTFPSQTEEDTFYFGDIEPLLQSFAARSRPFLADEKVAINLNALLIRLKILVDVWKRKEPTIFQGPNIVYVIRELEGTLATLERHEEGFKGKPGTHLRGFRSNIDDQVQYYAVHAPPQARQSNSPLPIVVFVPFTTTYKEPFLRSMHVAHHQILSMVGRLADESEYLVLWPAARGVTNGGPLGTVDILEALEAVKKDYPVDESRIYLCGFCTGGRAALLVAQRYPSLFAAAAVWGPSPMLRGGERQSLWIDANHERMLLDNLSNIPLYVMQGQDDVDPRPEGTEYFVEQCRTSGLRVDYELIPGAAHIYYATHPVPKMFNFFLGKRRQAGASEVVLVTGQLKYNESDWIRITALHEPMQVGAIKATAGPDGVLTVNTQNVESYEILTKKLSVRNGSRVSVISDAVSRDLDKKDEIAIRVRSDPHEASKLQKNHRIEGPIAHMFCDRFIAVQGTWGSPEEIRGVAGLIDRFRLAWLDRFHGDCLFKLDRDLTPEDVARCHLLLVGRCGANSILSSTEPDLPIVIDRNCLKIAGREYPGTNVAAQIVYPNPMNVQKYLSLIRAQSRAGYDSCGTDFVTDGWYDYAIWAETAQFIDAGYFSSDWNRLLPNRIM